MPVVTFRAPDGTTRSGTVSAGTRLLDASFSVGALVRTTCGGIMDCLECKVRIVEGMEHLSRVGIVEAGKLGTSKGRNERLACQARVFGEAVTVEIPDPPDVCEKTKLSP